MSLFLEGVVIGLAVAAPVGPIGVLCIRRTLAYGRASGFVSGLGAATADAAYGSVAALGLTFVTSLLVDAEAWLRLGGGVFLVFLGVKTFLSRPAERPAAAGRGGLPGAYASTLALTLANPSTILSFAAIFASLGAGSADGSSTALLLVPGVFLGSTLWWFVLSGATSLLRAKLPAGALRWVNRLSGAVLAGFGLVALSGLGG
jgi:threonine/homoserine/homoserine lactone efflux protein